MPVLHASIISLRSTEPASRQFCSLHRNTLLIMSCNDNQNHLVRPGRTTSRVLAKPGGQSSLTFGLMPSPSPPKKVEEAEPKKEKDVAKQEAEEVEKETMEVVPAVVSKEEVAVTKPAAATCDNSTTTTTAAAAAADHTSKPQSANAFVTGSNMNGGCVMTDRPTSRVLAPPGGHTSIQLG